jgi:tetratricopeptide (TPR) repeat protein
MCFPFLIALTPGHIIRTMRLSDAPGFVFILALGLTAAAPPAFPQPPSAAPAAPKSRQEAISNLASPDTATRAAAVVWIANRGGMQDARLLHERLRDESAFVRSFAEQGLWLLWSRSGDRATDARMAEGVELMQAGKLDEAVTVFSEIVKNKPGFAEGWNKRATAYYLAGEYRKSLADCDEVLRRNPLHFGALSGVGQIYSALEEYDKALQWFRRALEVNPNMLGVEINIKQVEERLKERRAKAI